MGIFEENIPDEIETWYIYDVRDRGQEWNREILYKNGFLGDPPIGGTTANGDRIVGFNRREHYVYVRQ